MTSPVPPPASTTTARNPTRQRRREAPGALLHRGEREHAARQQRRRRVEQRAAAGHDRGPALAAPQRQQHAGQHHDVQEPAREAAEEAVPLERQEQRGAEPRGGPPVGVLADDREHEPAGGGHQRDAEPLAERDRVGDVAREPEQRLVAVGIALRLAQRRGQRVAEQRRVDPAAHPVLMHEGVALDHVALQEMRAGDDGDHGRGGERRGALDPPAAQRRVPVHQRREPSPAPDRRQRPVIAS